MLAAWGHARLARAVEPPPSRRARSGGSDLAAASLLQQIAQATGLLILLAIVTVLARRLTLAELGTYGLVATLAVYLLVVKASVAGASVRAPAAARTDAERVGVFSTCTALYAAAGLVTGLAIAVVGLALAAALLDGELQRQAALGAVALGGVTAAGLVTTVNLDALRASLLLTRSAANEIAALIVFGALMLGLIAAGADPWVLIAGDGSIPLISGAINGVARMRLGLPWRLERRSISRRWLREIVPTAGHLLAIEVSSFVIYGLDLIVLGAFGSAATVGLYEGPVRAQRALRAEPGPRRDRPPGRLPLRGGG